MRQQVAFVEQPIGSTPAGEHEPVLATRRVTVDLLRALPLLAHLRFERRAVVVVDVERSPDAELGAVVGLERLSVIVVRRPAGAESPGIFDRGAEARVAVGRPGFALRCQCVAGQRECGADEQTSGDHPPVTLMWRNTAGRLARRSMMKSWPFGLRRIAASIAALTRSLLSDARSGARRSAASSCPRHMYSVPVQVRRTRLQLSQKLCVSGVMKPSRPPVSAIRT